MLNEEISTMQIKTTKKSNGLGSYLRYWITEMYKRDSILTITGLVHAILFVLFAGLVFVDSRTLLDINVWIKPMKFAISIAIYTMTLALIMKYVKNVRVQRFVSYGTVLAMYVETVIIATQAARGIKSHFNFDTALDASLYSLMGIMIGFATICSIVLAVHLFRTRLNLPEHFSIALRFGVLIFIFGATIGGYMSSGTQHTVGGTEGGNGLPFINWSMEVGDLRVAHFFGLHALQLIPLFSYLSTINIESSKIKQRVTWLIVIIYTLMVIGLFVQALAGNPFISM
jgi:hypothetical protein